VPAVAKQADGELLAADPAAMNSVAEPMKVAVLRLKTR